MKPTKKQTKELKFERASFIARCRIIAAQCSGSTRAWWINRAKGPVCGAGQIQAPGYAAPESRRKALTENGFWSVNQS